MKKEQNIEILKAKNRALLRAKNKPNPNTKQEKLFK
jgi:hypothetical protein